MARELKQAIIEEWVLHAHGVFNVKDIWAEVGIESPTGRQHLRVILGRMEEKKLVIKHNKDGLYRKLDTDLTPIDWQAADPNKVLPIMLPFDIHNYCRLYSKTIIILAGEKNEGKTAFLYESIVLNMERFIIDLYNSETGPEQMRERFESLDIPNPAPFNVYERFDNFSDVIHPEHFSVIDYLDFNSEVYLVGAEIDNIFRKLTTGIVLIALQKPPATVTYIKGVKKVFSRDLAYGGAFSAKRAALYISLGGHKAKLVYVKTPAKKTVNPNNMQWTYNFSDTGYFTNVERFYEERGTENV